MGTVRGLVGLALVAAACTGSTESPAAPPLPTTEAPPATTTTTAALDPATPPRLVLDPVPEGLADIMELPVPGQPFPMAPPDVSLTVYGDPGAAPSFGPADLAIYVTGQLLPIDDVGLRVRGHPAELRGRENRWNPTLDLTWHEGPGMEVDLSSYTLDGDQLAAIAEGLVVEGGTVRLGEVPPGLPGPLDELGRRVVWPTRAGSMTLVSYGALDGYMIQYWAPDPPGVYPDRGRSQGVYVFGFPAAASEIDALRWMARLDQAIDLGGRQVWTDAERTSFLWEEAPGWLVGVVRNGALWLDLDMVEIAGSVHPG